MLLFLFAFVNARSPRSPRQLADDTKEKGTAAISPKAHQDSEHLPRNANAIWKRLSDPLNGQQPRIQANTFRPCLDNSTIGPTNFLRLTLCDSESSFPFSPQQPFYPRWPSCIWRLPSRLCCCWSVAFEADDTTRNQRELHQSPFSLSIWMKIILNDS